MSGWCRVGPLAALALFVACSEGAGPRMDSNSNWLSACLDDSDCPDKSHCICGVCTRTCVDVLGCEGLDEAACVPLESGSVDALCGARALPSEAICLPLCELTEQCDEGQACVEGACVVPDAAAEREAVLCELGDGFWDETACGHYACGVPAECGEIVQGCDCGHDAVFDPQLGCGVADACTAAEQEALCGDTGGRWVAESCGHWSCGEAPESCGLPGCDCGTLRGFDPTEGCRVEDACLPTDRPDIACDVTGGTWHEDSCGHYECGVPPTCEDPVPGCDCGSERTFSEEGGCIEDEACGGPDSEQELHCAETGGIWHPDSCGHYSCGLVESCDVPTPGCDCGGERNFLEGEGCLLDAACVHEPEAANLCRETAGVWHEEACGHYECGEAGDCGEPEPGCDCGGARNFASGEGCLTDVACTGDSHESLCLETGGTWDTSSCGHYECGHEPACGEPAPGCDCGDLGVFDPGEGCIETDGCALLAQQALCEGSEGTWVIESCGHWSCGEEPTCEEPVPGCNCGAERNFAEGDGCVVDGECSVPDPEVLCGETDGTWDAEACGHYECGEAPACGEVVGGCNCGVERNFTEGDGCTAAEGCL